ncbi:MAG: DNA translocase FtsK, partial [Lachnospiraceae bacterium]|nr:DNA translocase FtsK [Lachnospiraceae bacterium]
MATGSTTKKRNSSTKRSTAGRSSSGTRKSSSARGSKNRSSSARSRSGSRTSNRNNANEGMINEITLIVIIAFSSLLLLSNLGIVGSLGDFISGILYGLFGIVSYLVPVMLVVASFFYISNKGNSITTVKIWAGVVLLMVFCALAQLLFPPKNTDFNKLTDYYTFCSGLKRGGGIVGGTLSSLLTKGIGTVGAYIVLIVLLVIAVILITERSIFRGMANGGRTLFDNARNDLERMRERRENERPLREEQKRLRQEEREARRLEEEELRRQKVAERDERLRQRDEERLQKRIDAEKQRRENLRQKEEGQLRIDKKVSGVILDAGLSANENAQDSIKADDHRDTAEDKLRDQGFHYKDDMHEISPGFSDASGKEHKGNGISGGSMEAPDQKQDVNNGHNTDNNGMRELHYNDPVSVNRPEYNNVKNNHSIAVAYSTAELESAIINETAHLSAERDYVNTLSRGRYSDDGFRAVESISAYDKIPDVGRYAESDSIKESAQGSRQDRDLGREQNREQNRDQSREQTKEQYREQYKEQYKEQYNGHNADDSRNYISDNSTMHDVEEHISGKDGFDDEEGGIGFSDTTVDAYKMPAVTVDESSYKEGQPPRAHSGGNIVPGGVEKKKPVREFRFPPINMLKEGKKDNSGDSKIILDNKALRLQETLKEFGVGVTMTGYTQGPAITRFEMKPDVGVKVSKVLNLSDDIMLSMAAKNVRIEAPIPGKALIGIELPNEEISAVMFRDLIESREFRESESKLSFAVGKGLSGETVVADIGKMPHLLIAGATGSGKSVCINTLIMSILYKARPDEVKLIMVDPKVVELSVYNGIPHLMIPVVTDPKQAAEALKWGVVEMDDRYNKFAEFGVRDLNGYNKKVRSMTNVPEQDRYKVLPRIVIIVDELADLMMVASKEVEESICRIAQKARAAGIHLVIATQRPSVDVVTGLIKANMPSRIAFSVSSSVDSRTILDMVGAEKLLGKGDMLFYPQGYTKPARVQGPFVSDQEVSDVVDFLKEHTGGDGYDEEIAQKIKSASVVQGGAAEAGGSSGGNTAANGNDELFYEAAKAIIDKNKASIGMLQRLFKIGFNRAARIMDQLADAGVVGEEEGTKPRKVLMTQEQL